MRLRIVCRLDSEKMQPGRLQLGPIRQRACICVCHSLASFGTLAAPTIARMPAFTAGGSSGQASITATRSASLSTISWSFGDSFGDPVEEASRMSFVSPELLGGLVSLPS